MFTFFVFLIFVGYWPFRIWRERHIKQSWMSTVLSPFWQDTTRKSYLMARRMSIVAFCMFKHGKYVIPTLRVHYAKWLSTSVSNGYIHNANFEVEKKLATKPKITANSPSSNNVPRPVSGIDTLNFTKWCLLFSYCKKYTDEIWHISQCEMWNSTLWPFPWFVSGAPENTWVTPFW